MSGKRALLLAAAGSLSVTAALAIAILLSSEFGDTQSRILATTALIGGFGLLALPASALFDQGRLRGLALLVVILCGLGFASAQAAVWTPNPPDMLGKIVGTLVIFAAATAQTAALAVRRNKADPRMVRWMFFAAIGLSLVIASMVTGLFWIEFENETYLRVLAALAVADVLAVALQPILARFGAVGKVADYRFRLYLESGDKLDFEIEAATFVDALAAAVRKAERKSRVIRIDRKTGSVS